MGGRKFRLAPHLKNEERSKKSALVVSIKRENISVHVSSVTITPSQLETTVDPQPLTCTVSVPLQVLSDALRYAAGYVPCALRKKVIRSSYSQERKTDLLNCLDDMVDADVVPCDSTDWIECVNRGGLTFVNDLTFEIFVAMELEIRIHLQGPQQPVNLSSIAPAIKNNA